MLLDKALACLVGLTCLGFMKSELLLVLQSTPDSLLILSCTFFEDSSPLIINLALPKWYYLSSSANCLCALKTGINIPLLNI